MDLTTIDVQHSAYVAFITGAGKTEHVREMNIDDLQEFLDSVKAWNDDSDNEDSQIIKIGVFNTLRENTLVLPHFHLINSYLVGLDGDGLLVQSGGGAGVPGPPHCCPS